jgi:hypothetical protein
MVNPTARNIALLSVFAFTAALLPATAAAALGDAEIQRPALGATITVKTSARFAGAVTSLVFRGKEFVDSRDHGRELQSASVYDSLGACFNPTEAGSMQDGIKQTSTSKLLAEKTGPNWIATETDMAFWLPPGWDFKRPCGPQQTLTRSVNTSLTGGHILNKRIEIGADGLENVIADHVTFTVPEAHATGQFEAATLYTPADFSQRYLLNLADGSVTPTSLFGEQGSPVILATPDNKYAVGIFAPAFPDSVHLGYGTFTFPDTNKINCVFRDKNLTAGQKLSFLCDFAVGNLNEVKAAILKLHANAQTRH